MNNSIVNFSKKIDLSSWRVVDDVVMGGLSKGSLDVNEKGNGLYSGEVSLENNGGFSLLKCRLDTINVSKFSKIVLRVKGDGKDYQFRIKDSHKNHYSFVKIFSTNKEWEEIEIKLSEMHPAFRGKKLQMNNFSSNTIEEVAVLIGNRKAEKFQLEIDKIYLK